MDSFLFSVNAVLPIMLLVALGYILKKTGIAKAEFLSGASRLTFILFLPVMLFMNVYKIGSLGGINWSFVGYSCAAVVCVFGLGGIFSYIFIKDRAKRGAVWQSVFRSNYAIIGIPLATMLFGEAGAGAASVLSAFAVPLFNILAVTSLVLCAPREGEAEEKRGLAHELPRILLGIIKNPLIISVFLGIAALGIRALFTGAGISFRLSEVDFLYTSLEYIARVATPLALIVLGGQFEIAVPSRSRLALAVAVAARTVLVPALGLGAALLLFPSFSGEHYAALVALFGTPTAVSSAIMAKEMKSDGELASQIVVWTTVASAFTLFAEIMLLKSAGIF